MRDSLSEYNESLQRILLSVLASDSGFLHELGVGDAQIFDDYFTFFYENGFADQAEFIRDLIVYIRDSGNKSFEETYILRETAQTLLDSLTEKGGDVG